MEERKDWEDAIVIGILVALLVHLPIALLFFPTAREAPGLVFRYMFTGDVLFQRWLMALAAGIAAGWICYTSRRRLTGGVQRVRHGAYGDAHFATRRQQEKLYPHIRYAHAAQPGIVTGCDHSGAQVDTSTKTVALVSPPGGGKTKSIFLPTLLYNATVNQNTGGKGASILSVDCKGEEYQTSAGYMAAHGYAVRLLDFRHPLQGLQFNLLQLINTYMDAAKQAENPAQALEARADAERHAKILADMLCAVTDTAKNGGENPFFEQTAHGLLTAVILLVAEYGAPEERHIISVLKLTLELAAPAGNINRLAALLKVLPPDTRAKLYAGATANADLKTAMNVFSSALAKLLAFTDAKTEQMVCCQSPGLTAQEFMDKPTCVYLVMPDEDTTAHFFATVYIQQITNSLTALASDREDLQLPRKVLVLWDEFGQAPPCKNMDSWVTAWRSRGIRLMLALQSEAQLDNKYGQQKAKVIRDAIQTRMYTNLPAGETAQKLSKELGNYTVVTKSVSNGKQHSSDSQSMTARPLLSADEIGLLPIGTWLILNPQCPPILTATRCYDEVWRTLPPPPKKQTARMVQEIVCLTEEKLYARCTVPEKPVEKAAFKNRKEK